MSVMSVGECPECESTDLQMYDMSEHRRKKCNECGSKLRPCTDDDCDGVMVYSEDKQYNKWSCSKCGLTHRYEKD